MDCPLKWAALVSRDNPILAKDLKREREEVYASTRAIQHGIQRWRRRRSGSGRPFTVGASSVTPRQGQLAGTRWIRRAERDHGVGGRPGGGGGGWRHGSSRQSTQEVCLEN